MVGLLASSKAIGPPDSQLSREGEGGELRRGRVERVQLPSHERENLESKEMKEKQNIN